MCVCVCARNRYYIIRYCCSLKENMPKRAAILINMD